MDGRKSIAAEKALEMFVAAKELFRYRPESSEETTATEGFGRGTDRMLASLPATGFDNGSSCLAEILMMQAGHARDFDDLTTIGQRD